MAIEVESARIKSVRTVTKADEEGEVKHTTAVTLVFEGLDMPTLEKLGRAAHLKASIDLLFDWPPAWQSPSDE